MEMSITFGVIFSVWSCCCLFVLEMFKSVQQNWILETLDVINLDIISLL